jgi:metallo-beta-lactamase family protein
MKIRFVGAAQTVTGSQHIITVNGKNILLDCGMYQGRRKEAFEKNRNFIYDPAKIDAVIISHAHIDHSGNLPNLVKHGFKGHIYATAATVDLCQLMLRDSAYIQEKDIHFVNKKRKKQNKNLFEMLYTLDDVEDTLSLFIGVQYNRTVEIFPGIKMTFKDAGHILGSAGVSLELTENGKTINLGYTGDVGRNEMPILRNPDVLRDLDYMIIESTYGNRIHDEVENVADELTQTINEVIDRKGKIIIPSFAVGRTQLLVYMLHKLWNQNRLPAIPVYIDSPLAVRSTEVFRAHPECFDRETYRTFLDSEEDPFGFEKIKYITSVEDSKRLNDIQEPCIIMSASGMAEAGRILHHLLNNIENSKNLVLFVGYAAENTLARKIMDGAEEVNILGETRKVKAQVKKMDYFSAHADQRELVEYISFNSPQELKKIFLVHGEPEQAMPLKEKIIEKGFKEVMYPVEGQIVTL